MRRRHNARSRVVGRKTVSGIVRPAAAVLTLLFLFFLARGFHTSAGAATGERYELRGRVLQIDGKPFRNGLLPVIFLHGSTTPFLAETVADPSGRFKFKDLLAGMYTVAVVVPQGGQLQQTVDIGPGSADARRRVEQSFTLDFPDAPPDWHTVSAVALSIPEKARREYGKARQRLRARDAAGATLFLRKAVEIAPRYVDAWNNLGTIAYQSRDYRQAEVYFREALKHDPDAYAPLVNLGGALLSQGRAPDSLPVNKQAFAARPGDALANSQLGQSYYLLGQPDSAEPYLKQAKALDPRHFSFPQLVLAEIYRQRRDYAAWAAELEEFLRYHPDSSVAPAAREALQQARLLERLP